MSSRNHPEITPDEIELFALIQRAVLHVKRLRILTLLSDHPRTWSELMQTLDLRNPKLLYDHLNLLQTLGIAEKDGQGQYVLTHKGRTILEATFREIKELSRREKEM
jgi:predicted transcriptional regulator